MTLNDLKWIEKGGEKGKRSRPRVPPPVFNRTTDNDWSYSRCHVGDDRDTTAIMSVIHRRQIEPEATVRSEVLN